MSEQTKKIINKKNTLEALSDTVATLVNTVTKGFARAKQDNDDLAVMVSSGFIEVGERIGRVEEVVGTLKSDVGTLKSDVNILKQGQEEIKLRLTNVAYRFELVDLQRRVQKVEDIVLARRKK
ncbi:MAG: hypothetical protein Q8Q23_03650 [bacterium]|nr:hypothetical protein [bacterium]